MRPSLLAATLAAGLLAWGACGEQRRGGARAGAPPVDADPAVVAVAAQGEALFFGRGGCSACHMVGKRGNQIIGPNLGTDPAHPLPVTRRRRHRGPPGLTYIIDSIVDPDAFVVAGYAPGVMKRSDVPPRSLTDQEIVALAVYVASAVGDPPPDTAALERAARRVDEVASRLRDRSARGAE